MKKVLAAIQLLAWAVLGAVVVVVEAQANVAVLAGSRTTATITATTYTATHCVAPTGNGTDDDDLGEASYDASAAAAGVCSTYTSLETAMVWGACGDVVKLEEGVYIHPALSTGGHVPAWYPRADCTAGNPFIVFAETPAGTNRASPFSASWTELRYDTPATIYGPGNPIIGSTNTTGGGGFIVDGLSARGTYVPAYPSQGAFAGGNDDVEFRRMYYDYEGPTNEDAADNYSAYYFEGGTNNKLLDSYCTGNFEPTSAQADVNSSCVTAYNTLDLIVRYCTFVDIDMGVWFKVGTNSGELSYSRFENASYGAFGVYSVQTGETVLMHHNLVIDGSFEDYVGPGAVTHTYSVYHNTFVGGVAAGTALNQVSMMGSANGNSTTTGDDQFYNNIVIVNDSHTTHMWYSLADTFANFFGNFTLLDFNGYYDSTGAANFGQSGDTTNTFEEYRTAIDGLGAAVREDNSFEGTITLDANYCLVSNGQTALTASDINGPIGFCVLGTERPGIRTAPTYP